MNRPDREALRRRRESWRKLRERGQPEVTRTQPSAGEPVPWHIRAEQRAEENAP